MTTIQAVHPLRQGYLLLFLALGLPLSIGMGVLLSSILAASLVFLGCVILVAVLLACWPAVVLLVNLRPAEHTIEVTASIRGREWVRQTFRQVVALEWQEHTVFIDPPSRERLLRVLMHRGRGAWFPGRAGYLIALTDAELEAIRQAWSQVILA